MGTQRDFGWKLCGAGGLLDSAGLTGSGGMEEQTGRTNRCLSSQGSLLMNVVGVEP